MFLASGKAVSKNDEPYELRPGGAVYRAPRDIVNAVRNFEFTDRAAYDLWLDKCRLNADAMVDAPLIAKLREIELVRSVPALEQCHLASGPIVGASTPFSEWLLRRDREFFALDMEAGGAMLAASERVDPTRMIVVRGVSDYGDERKAEMDALGGGSLRRYAMRNAVELLFTLLNSPAANLIRDA
jgi:nucleoside phosphorylase